MVKRKRGDEEFSLNVSAVFLKHRDELFRAIKNAKGRERQRQSKRLKDAKSTPDKKARIEKEIVILNSLDLHQTAHAHLCSSLLRFRSIAEHEKLPTEIKGGVPKPELTEEEKTALHNVTSALYSHAGVKEVVAKALENICKALGVPVPEKKGKGKKEKTDRKEEVKETEEPKREVKNKEWSQDKKVTKEKGEKDEKKDKKEKDTKQKKVKDLRADDDDEEEDVDINYGEEVDETVVSRMADLLGSSSEDEDDDEAEKLELAKQPNKPKTSLAKDLDPMEITSEEEGDSETDSDNDSDNNLDPMEVTDDEADGQNEKEGNDEFAGFSDSNQSSASDSDSDEDEDQQSDSSSSARSPPPKKNKRASKIEVNGSTFLPSLMGGYISGSESASDVDIAPARKNRRGQRARQAIWEKKFKEQAKHLKKQQEKRDAGWDLKRGAVDGDNKPWKKGIKNPFKATGANDVTVKKEEPPKKDRARDDLGTLHPSWEARRLAKEKEKLTAPFEGKKITFD
ncbi:Bud-site selection protein [Triangularia setosa]|uniref:Bud-site selection protein n=1 Tax=Triangularia setosa TaxID=2587417 RepID=A0AAN7A3W6_9PEZI|nr:Bud-site selection protein [Podospora setosa]